MWSLLAVTPGVQMQRIDVGGNRAGTQTGYAAYGQTGQVRVLIEGINTTEGTGGAGFYFDYSSLEEVFLGTSGQSAEMPNPGVQSQFIAKSGGNQFTGEYYLDWYNNSLQGSNIPDEYIDADAPSATSRFGSTATRSTATRTSAVNVGGPIKRDKIWWFAHLPQAVQRDRAAELHFRQDVRYEVVELGRQGHLSDEPEPQDHRLLPVGPEDPAEPPARLLRTYNYLDAEPTNRQDSGSWVYKAEWNGTISDKLYVEARYGDFGYYFPQITNGTEPYFFRDNGRLEISRLAHEEPERSRSQAVDRRCHLFPRHGQGQPHDQGRRARS